jgi:hypothetical protein
VFVPWTTVTDTFDVLGVLESGRYSLQLRTYDLAGNIKPTLYEGLNQHTWIYETGKLPVGMIVGLLLGLIVAGGSIAALLVARRRKKKRAMEGYAPKRSKLKGTAKDSNKVAPAKEK